MSTSKTVWIFCFCDQKWFFVNSWRTSLCSNTPFVVTILYRSIDATLEIYAAIPDFLYTPFSCTTVRGIGFPYTTKVHSPACAMITYSETICMQLSPLLHCSQYHFFESEVKLHQNQPSWFSVYLADNSPVLMCWAHVFLRTLPFFNPSV